MLRVGIIAIAKNENLYLREWFDWHLGLGFDHIIIGLNDDEFKPLITNPRVTYKDYSGIDKLQTLAYTEMYQEYRDQFDWLLFIDIDEFVMLDDQKVVYEAAVYLAKKAQEGKKQVLIVEGGPGTGKSVIAQAIAEHLNAKFSVLNGADVESIEEVLSQMIVRPDNECYTVLCIEDIDCAFTNNSCTFNRYISDDEDFEEDNKKTNKRNRRLAAILNCMDGVNATDNIIYVLTTNHIETLDPALIRPGRCDLKIEMKGVCEETFREFCMFHYKRTPDRTVNIHRHVTFAELQTDVMRGCTIEQLIDKLEDNHHVSTVNDKNE